MEKARTLISSLRKDLIELDKKLEQFIQTESISNDLIDKTTECLNDAIRVLDHTVEHILDCKR